MEFKFRAIDEQPQRPSTLQQSSSSLTYFTEQAIRVGYSSTGNGRPIEFVGNPINMREPIRREFEKEQEFFGKPMDFREAMLREIEKQRIREEIIAAEMARKRLLEEEVRRELFMERELGIGRTDGFLLNHLESKSLKGRIALTLERRLGYTAHCETSGAVMVPFQRNVEPKELKITEIKPLSEVSKEKVMLLAKPESNLCGTKRKALTPPKVGLGELPSIAPKKKLKEDWICSICEISTTSELALNEHLEGKKHKAKEARLRAQSTGQNIGLGIDQKVKLLPKNSGAESSCKIQVVSDSRKLGEKTGQSKKILFKFWCEMCKVGAHSGKVMNKHKKGKKHLYLLELSTNRAQKVELADALGNCKETAQMENAAEKAAEDGKKGWIGKL